MNTMKKFHRTNKKMGKVTVGIVAFAMICGFLFSSVTVSAAVSNKTQIVEKTETSACAYSTSLLKNSCTYDGGGNYYSSYVFSSLSAAQRKLGNFTFVRCYKVNNGVRYNYYYPYSDGTKCYFRVE